MTTTRRAQEEQESDIHKRARWVQNSAHTLILKCCVKDGSAVLAKITVYHFFLYHWDLEGQDIGGKARSRYAAMRRTRKALREAAEK